MNIGTFVRLKYTLENLTDPKKRQLVWKKESHPIGVIIKKYYTLESKTKKIIDFNWTTIPYNEENVTEITKEQIINYYNSIKNQNKNVNKSTLAQLTLKKWDKVKLIRLGIEGNEYNPGKHNPLWSKYKVHGKIISINKDKHLPIKIEWENNSTNRYTYYDLEKYEDEVIKNKVMNAFVINI